LVHFSLKIWHLVATILIISSIVKRLLWRASPLARGPDFIPWGQAPGPSKALNRAIFRCHGSIYRTAGDLTTSFLHTEKYSSVSEDCERQSTGHMFTCFLVVYIKCGMTAPTFHSILHVEASAFHSLEVLTMLNIHEVSHMKVTMCRHACTLRV